MEAPEILARVFVTELMYALLALININDVIFRLNGLKINNIVGLTEIKLVLGMIKWLGSQFF